LFGSLPHVRISHDLHQANARTVQINQALVADQLTFGSVLLSIGFRARTYLLDL